MDHSNGTRCCCGVGDVEIAPSQREVTECSPGTDAKIRGTVYDTIIRAADDLKAVSLYLHDNPETNFEEFKAHAKLTDCLERLGFTVERGYMGMPTAFKASYSRGEGATFGMNSEYDALPGVGHACGHNLIAVSGVAALLGMREAMKQHDICGNVVLLGTPAEEGGAGKVQLLEKSGYAGIDACMMIHPAGPIGNHRGFIRPTLAVRTIFVEFQGMPAHAMVAPWQGKNALDAANIAYMSISSMRQQLKKNDYVHGIIVSGGDAANIIPKYTSMRYYCRSINATRLEELMDKIIPCFNAAALATGCKLSLDIGVLRSDVRHSLPLAREYSAVMAHMFQERVQVDLRDEAEPVGSTDFGNARHRELIISY
ncbi:hypothetical protein JCM24511_06177 [Saitozyma sp. JCM 24511]|nr:hypothetical protein JCM24511_06177 [Saitozyma sp. JCM 24511]